MSHRHKRHSYVLELLAVSLTMAAILFVAFFG